VALWSYWFPDLLTHVPGCPIPLAVFELRRAAQAFFKSARAWQVTQPLVPITAAQTSVTVALDSAEQELVRVEKAWLDGNSLAVQTLEGLDDSALSDDWTLHTGTPTALVQLTPGVLTLYPVPTANALTGLKLRVSVRPSDASTGVPDEMAVKFRDEIHAGAKARLMMYPGRPWSNPEMALLNAGTFEAGVGAANLAAARSFGRGRIAGRPRWC